MQIIRSLDGLRINEKTAVALGNFDGIHIGHKKIMENALEAAGKEGLRSLCFTFSNHPFNFILGREDDDPAAVKLICSEEDKTAMIDDMGFDIRVNVPFDEQIMKMKAHDFFSGILRDRLNAGYISAGFNYSYGARAGGTPEMLRAECLAAGIGCEIQDAVTIDGKVISSTLIRELISEGNMELVKRCLGRALSFSGRVEHGRRIGSANGIPTANTAVPPERMLPPRGVYFSRIVVDGIEYCSISNIGVNPTVSNANAKTIETYIFDFDQDVYDEEITVYFDHFSRGERKFRSKGELFDQISRDCDQARAFHYDQ